jgi:hypothetical protein
LHNKNNDHFDESFGSFNDTNNRHHSIMLERFEEIRQNLNQIIMEFSNQFALMQGNIFIRFVKAEGKIINKFL